MARKKMMGTERASMRRITAVLFATAWSLVALTASGAAQESFDDVPQDGFYHDAVEWLRTAGLFGDHPPGAFFRPNEPVTRGEVTTFLWRLAGEPTAPVHAFNDVVTGDVDNAVAWISHRKISQGSSPTIFDPDGLVTRGELAVFLHRLADEPAAPLHAFSDPVRPVYEAPISWISSTGISTGVAPGEFGADVPVSRGQMAVFLQRFDSLVDLGVEAPAPTPTEVARSPEAASETTPIRRSVGEATVPIVVVAIALALGAGGLWLRRAGPRVDENQELGAPEPPVSYQALAPPTISDKFSVSPVAFGELEHLALHDGALWSTTHADLGAGDHAMVLRTAGPNHEWEVVADLGRGRIDAITVSDSDAIAIGARFLPGDPAGQGSATIWHSTTLESWMAIGLAGDPFKGAIFDGVLGIGETLVAYGRNAEGPSLWTGSETGWIHRGFPGSIDLVVDTGHGGLLFGRDSARQGAVVLVSSNGGRWDHNDHPSTVLFGSSSVRAAVDFDGGVVAAGCDHARGAAAVWVSDDGIGWHLSPMEFDEGTTIEHLAVVDDVVVAVGSIRASGPAAGSVAVWRSADVVQWTLEDDGGLGSGGRVSAVALNGSLVISGERTIAGEVAPVMWRYFGAHDR